MASKEPVIHPALLDNSIAPVVDPSALIDLSRSRLEKHPSIKWRRVAVLSAVLFVAIAIRLENAAHALINSDEPQHMHVLWGLSQGWVQYRDIWDNHAPLFYTLWRPLFALAPSDSSVFLWMRLTMLPLNLVAMAATYFLGRILYGHAVGLWAAGFLLLWPTSQRLAIELRPDQLWAACWVTAMVLLAGGIRRPWQAALFGLALGAALAVSLKSVVLIACLPGAALMTRIVAGPVRRWPAAHVARVALAVLAGTLAIPLAIVCWFWRRGALAALYRGTITFNTTDGTVLPHKHHFGVPIFIGVSLVSCYVIRRAVGNRTVRGLGRRRLFFVCTTILTIAAFKALWPIFERQDWLPMAPLLAATVCGLFLGSLYPRPRFTLELPHALKRRLAPLALAICAVITVAVSPFHSPNQNYLTSLDIANALAGPGDKVVDTKGELVFHPRALSFVCETLTREKMHKDPQLDHGLEEIVAAGAMISAPGSRRLPAATNKFVHENFLPVAKSLSVAGKKLKSAGTGDPGALTFQVALPGEYDLVTRQGVVKDATLDGVTWNGPTVLTTGNHVVRVPGWNGETVAILWHRAVARGYQWIGN